MSPVFNLLSLALIWLVCFAITLLLMLDQNTPCVFRSKPAGVSEQFGHPVGVSRPPSRTKPATEG